MTTSRPFERTLDEIIGKDHPTLRSDLTDALARYRDSRRAGAALIQQRDAAVRLRKAALKLSRETQRADVAFGANRRRDAAMATLRSARAVLRGETMEPDGEWTAFLPHAWRELDADLSRLRDRIEAWLAKTAKPKARRGAPHHGRFHLRIRTFQALARHRIPIRKNGESGKPARVLAAVLAEADRIDEKPAKDRPGFNGTQWAQWLAEHRQIDKLLVRAERDGLRRQHVLDDLLQYVDPHAMSGI